MKHKTKEALPAPIATCTRVSLFSTPILYAAEFSVDKIQNLTCRLSNIFYLLQLTSADMKSPLIKARVISS